MEFRKGRPDEVFDPRFASLSHKTFAAAAIFDFVPATAKRKSPKPREDGAWGFRRKEPPERQAVGGRPTPGSGSTLILRTAVPSACGAARRKAVDLRRYSFSTMYLPSR